MTGRPGEGDADRDRGPGRDRRREDGPAGRDGGTAGSDPDGRSSGPGPGAAPGGDDRAPTDRPSTVDRDCKIVCTLGPASRDRETVRRLVDAGMSVARLNASHGTPERRRSAVETVRAVDRETATPVATMLDVAGPEVRTLAPAAPVALDAGTELHLVGPDGDAGDDADGDAEPVGGGGGDDADRRGAGGGATAAGRPAPGDGTRPPIAMDLSRSIAAVAPGDRVLLDDGRVETVVDRVEGETVVVAVREGGELTGGEGVNVPGVDLGLPAVTDADRRDLRMAAETGVDFVAASLVRSAADVRAVREVLEGAGADVPVVAKVERAEAVENAAGIVGAADAAMVARGDLGVECPLERVPLIQKRLIRRCHRAGVPVITATEMLDSMVHEGRPTRAEASDVANAVLDGTDAVMLSAETAVGDHPVRVVETMDRIVRDVEGSAEYAEIREQRVPGAGDNRTDALARSARYLARDVDATAVVVASESGYTARAAAKFRPAVPVVAATPDDRVRRQLTLSWGVVPRHAPLPGARGEGATGVGDGPGASAPEAAAASDGATDGPGDGVGTGSGDADAPAGGGDGVGAVVRAAVGAAIEAGVVAPGETVVVLSGTMTGAADDVTNTLKVHVAAARLATGRGVVGGRTVGPVARPGEDVPEGAVLLVGADRAGPIGDADRLAAVVAARLGTTGPVAAAARGAGVPMVSGADLPDPEKVPSGTVVTVDADRGVVYEGDVAGRG